MRNSLAKAIRIAAEAFENKTDKGGNPYILHCLHVMNQVSYLGEDAMIIAVLHDLLEDTQWTEHMLVTEGFSQEVIDNIKCMTHSSKEDYMVYIKRIALNDNVRKIKMADLCHNSDITRMKGLTKKDFDRLEKYHIAYEYLREP